MDFSPFPHVKMVYFSRIPPSPGVRMVILTFLLDLGPNSHNKSAYFLVLTGFPFVRMFSVNSAWFLHLSPFKIVLFTKNHYLLWAKMLFWPFIWKIHSSLMVKLGIFCIISFPLVSEYLFWQFSLILGPIPHYKSNLFWYYQALLLSVCYADISVWDLLFLYGKSGLFQ